MKSQKKLVSKRVTEKKVQRNSERRTGVYFGAPEDSSDESTRQLASAVESRKKNNVEIDIVPLDTIYFNHDFYRYKFRSESLLIELDEYRLSCLNKDIVSLNEIITRYNLASNVNDKQNLIKLIYKTQRDIDLKYSANLKLNCSNYIEQFYESLPNNLISQLPKIGLKSIEDLNDKKDVINNDSQLEFAIFISGMNQEKINAFTLILSKAKRLSEYEHLEFNRSNIQELRFLYKKSEVGYDDYNRLLANNSITFLGGVNSKNFKVTPTNGAPPFVLKVDNNGEYNNKEMDNRLRQSNLSKYLTPIYGERRTYFTKDDDLVIRSLLITDFCSGGDLVSHSQNFTNNNQSAIKIYGQMASILQDLQNAGASFPDMKNANWLIDEKGELHIADTKSFLSSQSDGFLCMSSEKNKMGYLVSSRQILAPEMQTYFKEYLDEMIHVEPNNSKMKWSTDKMHSYIFGKNLYQYLTGCSDYELSSLEEITAKNLIAPIFNTGIGEVFAEIIIGTVKKSPNHRFSIDSIVSKMRYLEINMPYLEIKQQCLDKLKEIKASSLNSHKSENMQNYIKNQEQLLDKCKSNIQKLEKISANLELTLLRTKCFDTLFKIEELKLGSNDIEMNKYLLKKMELLSKCKKEECSSQLMILNKTLENMSNNKSLDLIKKTAQSFRDNDCFYKPGMVDKAKMIENAYKYIPVEKRELLFTENSSVAQYELQIEKSIASLRGFFCVSYAPEKDGKIDEDRSSRTYKNFKYQLNEIKLKTDRSNANEKDSNCKNTNNNKIH